MPTHSHLGQPVRFPVGAQPGDRITFRDHFGRAVGRSPGARDRTGVVIDRAPQGIDLNPGIHAETFEAAGYWLWVVPDDHDPCEDPDGAVRVRYYSRGRRKGEAHADDGPMYVRSIIGYDEVWHDGHRYDEVAWMRHRGRGACKCCAQEARTG